MTKLAKVGTTLDMSINQVTLFDIHVWQNRLNQYAFGGARLPLDTKHPERELIRTVPSSTPHGRT